MTTWDRLHELAAALPALPLTYTPPAHPHDHWQICDATGTILACPHQPPHPALAAYLTQAPELFAALADTTPAPEPTPHPQRPSHERSKGQEAHPSDAAPSLLELARIVPRPDAPPPPDTARLWLPSVLPQTAAWLDAHGMSREDVWRILADPLHTRPGRDGARIYAGVSHEVVLSADASVVLAVYPRPDTPSPAASPTPAPRSTPQRSRTHQARPPHKLTGDPAQFAALLQLHGFTMATTPSGHQRVTHPQHPGRSLNLPSTPSDHRWALNAAARIRRAFGVDLRLDP